MESYYWKEDLISYVNKLRPVSNPPRLSERLVANFEKYLIVSFFMLRKLLESNRLSSKTAKHKIKVFRAPCFGSVNNRNYLWVDELYDLNTEEEVHKDVRFVSNQLIHCGAIFAYREKDRNWGGVYTCSDFERSQYIYRLPLCELLCVLEIASTDYPKLERIYWDDKLADYVRETD